MGRWLDPEHPDPVGRNMRELWLPALEWYYSQRVERFPSYGALTDAKSGEALSDEAILAAADFAIFIE